MMSAANNAESRRKSLTRNGDDVPATLSVRCPELAPLLEKWRANNRRVPWSCLLIDALKKELAPLAGKRYAHLVEAEGKEAA